MAQFAKSIQLFLMDQGDPNGRWRCELSNWTGVAYKIPRHFVSTCVDRPELNRCAVYFLFGYDMDADKPLIYVGETEEVMVRFKKHLEEKDYWNEAIIFISKDDHLNKAHIKYLEHRFYSIALEAKRYVVQNGNTPKRSSISESESAELEEFIYNAKILINTLGHKVFEPAVQVDQKKTMESGLKLLSELLYLNSSAKGAKGIGQVTADGFVVMKGSTICPEITKSTSPGIIKLRDRLIQSGKIVDQVFIEDIIFTSSSYAAACIMGHNISGPRTWKTSDGVTLKELEEGFSEDSRTKD